MIKERTHNCARPNGVRISAPSLYVQVFKKARGPEALSFPVEATACKAAAKLAGADPEVGYLDASKEMNE